MNNFIEINKPFKKVEHTSGKTSPTVFQQKDGFFYVPFDLTNERRMKEKRPTA